MVKVAYQEALSNGLSPADALKYAKLVEGMFQGLPADVTADQIDQLVGASLGVVTLPEPEAETAVDEINKERVQEVTQEENAQDGPFEATQSLANKTFADTIDFQSLVRNQNVQFKQDVPPTFELNSAYRETIDINPKESEISGDVEEEFEVEEAVEVEEVELDTLAPTVSSVSVPTDNTYDVGQSLDFTINFSEDVTVTGTDSTLGLTLNTGGSVSAAYLSSSGSSVVYRYTVLSGELDADGITIGNLAFNTSTIKDGSANALTDTTLNSVGDASQVLVDGVGPSVSLSLSTTTPTESGADTVTITATAAEAYTTDMTVNLTYDGTATGGGIDYSDGVASSHDFCR